MGLFDGFGLHPILSMGLECAMFSFIGSFLCQVFFAKGKGWDILNMLILMSYSAVCFAPTAFYWYPFIESLFPGNDMKNVGLKLLMDQLIYSPLLLAWFWLHSTFLSTFNLNKSIDSVKQNVMSSLISNWCYWPFVQVVNIGYVPDQYKVLLINLASIPWNIYVSYSVANQKEQQQQPPSKGKGKKKKKKRKDQ
eukprot:71305_1